jgi:hypothetical protein
VFEQSVDVFVETDAAGVDHDGQALRAAVGGPDLREEVTDERQRQVVDHVPAELLEDLGGRALARSRHPADQE